MKNRHFILIYAISIVALLLFSSSLFSKKRFKYVGIKTCKKCHNTEGSLDQYIIWLSSPHANAIGTLYSRRAKKIAAKHSIKKPQESLKCLRCHTTGRGKVKETIDEGVGCEACHGPGGGYHEFGNHVNFQQKRNGYMRAKKFGMYPILDYEDNLKKRERLCMSCHTTKRLCMPTTKREILRQKMTIHVIDSLRKGDVNFSHPAKKY